MSRLVLDTNVVFAAFAARGICEAVFELCLERGCLVTSEFLLGELSDKLRDKLKLLANEVIEIVNFYRSKCEVVDPVPVPADVCRDPDDLPVIGTCLGGQAMCLVTGDKDLLDIVHYCGVEIMSPRILYCLLGRFTG